MKLPLDMLKNFFMFILPVTVYYLAGKQGLPENFSLYAAITVWAVYCWASSFVSSTMVAIVLPILYIVSGIAKPSSVFASWGSTVPWLCFSGIIIGHMLLKTGLANRLAYKCILVSGNRFYNTLFGLVLCGLIIAPLIPTALGKVSIFCVLGIGLANALEFDANSKESASIMLTCFLAVAPPSLCFLTGCVQIPSSIQIMTQASGISVSWFEYAWQNFLPALLYSLSSFALMLFILRPANKNINIAIIMDKYHELGPISLNEKKAIILLLFTLIFLATDSWHQINVAWGMTLIATFLFLPGLNLLSNKDFDQMNLSVLFFIGGAMSIGSVAADIGVAKQLAETVVQLFSIQEKILYLWVSYFFGILTLFFLTPMTGLAALSIPLTEIALKVGIDPRAMLYSFIYGMDQYTLPYQYAVLLFLYSYRRLKMVYLVKLLIGKAVMTTVLIFPLLLLYWKLIGLW